MYLYVINFVGNITPELMPIVLRINGYRFWFYEADLNEPPHVHIGKGDKQAKYWLAPISCARSKHFREHELNEIETIIITYKETILQAWQNEKKKHGNR